VQEKLDIGKPPPMTTQEEGKKINIHKE